MTREECRTRGGQDKTSPEAQPSLQPFSCTHACISPNIVRSRFLCFLLHHCCRALHCGAENARNMPLLLFLLAALSRHTAAFCSQLPAGTRLAAGTASSPSPQTSTSRPCGLGCVVGETRRQPLWQPFIPCLSLDLLSPYLLGPAS